MKILNTNLEGRNKEERYLEILPQIRSLVEDESDLIANLANIIAVLRATFEKISWVGYYLLKRDILVLGPFQGKVACVRIRIGEGVCGNAAQQRRTIIVSDVEKYPGHIYCDPDSRSEIVVPLITKQGLLGVLDIDSYSLSSFDEIDRKYLEEIAAIIVACAERESI